MAHGDIDVSPVRVTYTGDKPTGKRNDVNWSNLKGCTFGMPEVVDASFAEVCPVDTVEEMERLCEEIRKEEGREGFGMVAPTAFSILEQMYTKTVESEEYLTYNLRLYFLTIAVALDMSVIDADFHISEVWVKPDLVLGVKKTPKLTLEFKKGWAWTDSERLNLAQILKSEKKAGQKAIIAQSIAQMSACRTKFGMLTTGNVFFLQRRQHDEEKEKVLTYKVRQGKKGWHQKLALFCFNAYMAEAMPPGFPPKMRARASGEGDLDPHDDDEEVDPCLARAMKYDFSRDSTVVTGDGYITGYAWRKSVDGRRVVVKAGEVYKSTKTHLERREMMSREIKVHEEMQKVLGADVIPRLEYHGPLLYGRMAIATTDAGTSLSQWSAPDIATAIEVGKEAVRKLDRVHQAGYVHGDIALRNFAVDDKGCVRVLDLGNTWKPESREIAEEARGERQMLLQCIEEGFGEVVGKHVCRAFEEEE